MNAETHENEAAVKTTFGMKTVPYDGRVRIRLYYPNSEQLSIKKYHLNIERFKYSITIISPCLIDQFFLNLIEMLVSNCKVYSSYLDSVVGAVRVIGAAVYRGGSHPPPSTPVDLHVRLHLWPTTKHSLMKFCVPALRVDDIKTWLVFVINKTQKVFV